jgi:hypothetical protein
MVELNGYVYPEQFQVQEGLVVQTQEAGFFKRKDTENYRICLGLCLFTIGLVGIVWGGKKAYFESNWKPLINGLVGGGILLTCPFYFSEYFLESSLEDKGYREHVAKKYFQTMTGVRRYILKYGWKNIEQWGLNMDPSSSPIITKKQLKTLFFNECHTRLDCVLHTHKFSEGKIIEKKAVLFELLDHPIFDENDKQEIARLIAKHFWENRQKDTVNSLYYLLPKFESYMLNTDPLMQTFVQFFKDHQEKIDKCMQEIKETTPSYSTTKGDGFENIVPLLSNLGIAQNVICRKVKFFSSLFPEFESYVYQRHPELKPSLKQEGVNFFDNNVQAG